MGIKAIETKYKGYKFRSRTEARWAVFFDHLNIRWEYEHQGYEISEVGRYLPDFHLPSFRDMSYDGGLTFTRESAFVEIKGEYPTRKEIEKLAALCAETGKPGWVVCGVPSEECWIVDVSAAVDCISIAHFTPDEYWLMDENMSPFSPCWEACNAAKSARFEFGQYGA